MAVLEAPTLQPAMDLCSLAIVVQHKGALTALVSFIEQIFALVAERNLPTAGKSGVGMQQGTMLEPYVLKISEDLLKQIFQLIAQVPTQFQQEIIQRALIVLRRSCHRPSLGFDRGGSPKL